MTTSQKGVAEGFSGRKVGDDGAMLGQQFSNQEEKAEA